MVSEFASSVLMKQHTAEEKHFLTDHLIAICLKDDDGSAQEACLGRMVGVGAERLLLPFC